MLKRLMNIRWPAFVVAASPHSEQVRGMQKAQQVLPWKATPSAAVLTAAWTKMTAFARKITVFLP